MEVDAEELVDVAGDVGDEAPDAMAAEGPKLMFGFGGCSTRGDGCGDSTGVQSTDMDVDANRLRVTKSLVFIIHLAKMCKSIVLYYLAYNIDNFSYYKFRRAAFLLEATGEPSLRHPNESLHKK